MPEDQVHYAPPWVMRDEPESSRIPSEMQPVADYLRHSWKVTTGQEYPTWVKTERQKDFYENAMMAIGLVSPFKGGGIPKEVDAMLPMSKSVEKLEPPGEQLANTVAKERGHGMEGEVGAPEAPSDQDRFGRLLVSPAVKNAMPARNTLGKTLRTVSAGDR